MTDEIGVFDNVGKKCSTASLRKKLFPRWLCLEWRGGKRRMISRVIDIWSAFGFYF